MYHFQDIIVECSLIHKPSLIVHQLALKKQETHQPSFDLHKKFIAMPYYWFFKSISLKSLLIDDQDYSEIFIYTKKKQIIFKIQGIEIDFDYLTKSFSVNHLYQDSYFAKKTDFSLLNQNIKFQIQQENKHIKIEFRDLIDGHLTCNIQDLVCHGYQLKIHYPDLIDGIIERISIGPLSVGSVNINAIFSNLSIPYLPSIHHVTLTSFNQNRYVLQTEDHTQLEINIPHKAFHIIDRQGQIAFQGEFNDEKIIGCGNLSIEHLAIPYKDNQLFFEHLDLLNVEYDLASQDLKIDAHDLSLIYNHHYAIKKAQGYCDKKGFDFQLKDVVVEDTLLPEMTLMSHNDHLVGNGLVYFNLPDSLHKNFNVVMPNFPQSTLLRHTFTLKDEDLQISFHPVSSLYPDFIVNTLFYREYMKQIALTAKASYQSHEIECRLPLTDALTFDSFVCTVKPANEDIFLKKIDNEQKDIVIQGVYNKDKLDMNIVLNSYQFNMLPHVEALSIKGILDSNIYEVKASNQEEYVIVDCSHQVGCQILFKAGTLVAHDRFLNTHMPQSSFSTIDNIQGTFDSFIFNEYAFQGSIEKDQEKMTISLDSDRIKGSFFNNQRQTAVKLNFLDLYWAIKKGKKMFNFQDQALIQSPSYLEKNWIFDCDRLVWKNSKIGSLKVEYLVDKDKRNQHEINLTHRAFNMKAISTVEESNAIQATGILHIDSIENLLEPFVEKSFLKDGYGSIKIEQLDADFDNKVFSGSFILNINDLFVADQQINHLKILNIFSGYIFSKQQARSLVEDGLPIDTLSAHCDIRDNLMTIKKLEFKSGATAFIMDGTYDLKTRHVDLDVHIYPKISAALPAAALLLGNIPAGIFMAGLNYFAGRDINKMNHKQLHLKGPIDRCEIENWSPEIIEFNLE